MLNKKSVINVFLIIICIILSFFSGFFLFGYLNEAKMEKNIYDKVWNEAKDRYIQNNACGVFSDEKLRNINVLSGVVEKVNDNSIKVYVKPLWPFSDPSLDYRIIKVKDSTSIIKRIKKDDTLYKDELDQYAINNKFGNNSSIVNYPKPYIEKEIKLFEINKDDRISFKASYNIAEELDVDVEEILINY